MTFAESLLAISLALSCFAIIVLAFCAMFDSERRADLAAFANCAHNNWRVALVFLFPMVRLSWLRIEPRIRKIGASTELDAAPNALGSGHITLPEANPKVQ